MEQMDTAEITEPKKLVIDLPILESIKDLQSQHGIKYENYQRYRSYCSRRLHRVRRSLNVHQGVAPSAKARHQRGRKLMDVGNAMVLEAGEKDPEYAERMLMIPLCLAERAWSYAMQLKQEVTEQPRRRFHLVRRLKKAAEHATRFEKLCHDPDSPCTDQTKLEATAYAAYINGLYKLEREYWAEAKENLQRALKIYFTVSLSIRKDDVLEHYRQRIDELRASLRYCTFNLSEKDKVNKVKLPATLQFHDLAFRHAKQLQEQEAAAAAAPVDVVTAAASTLPSSKAVTKKVDVVEPAKLSPTKESPKKDAKSTFKTVQPKAVPSPAAPVPEEEEEEEFEETREAIDEESETSGEDEETTDDEDDKSKQTRAGGVTGLVKGWLGGAWS